MAGVPQLLLSKPGIARDGTRFSRQNYIDGEWVRFDRGLPRKMGGYKKLSSALASISRGLHGQSSGGITTLHSGAFDRLDKLLINVDGSVSIPTDRTPTVGFTSDAMNTWTFDTIQDSVLGEMTLLAHAAPNGLDIDQTVDGSVFYGNLYGTTALSTVMDGATPFKVAGGLCVVHPFGVYFGNDGQLIWSVAGKPTDVTTTSGSGTFNAGEARPTSKKIIAGRQTRGAAAQSPSALLWSLNEVVRMSFVGGAGVWSFDRIASSTLLSANAIVEYDGAYYWPGNGRFYAYNGVVRDLPNAMNRRWFFKNLNWNARGRVFGVAIPEWDEIWWMFPKGDSTECNHAIIFNTAQGIWYDTPLPNEGRSAAIPADIYRWPIMAGVQAKGNPGTFRLWQHEIGTDEVDDSDRAIRSYFETADISMLKSEKPTNAEVKAMHLEPDFTQSGKITLQVLGNVNARAPTFASETHEISESAADSSEEIVPLKHGYRQLRMRFESNELGGDYEMGSCYVHLDEGGERNTS